MRHSFRKLVLLSILFFLPLLIPRNSFAQTILFQDDFNDGNASGWIVPRNTCSSSWQVNNLRYGIIIDSSCVTESIPVGLLINPTLPYSFEVDMTMASSANMDRNFVFKYQNSNNWYGIHTIGNNVYVQKVVGGTEYFLTNRLSSFSFQDNQTYHFNVEVYPSQIKVYINGSLNNTVNDQSPTFFNSSAGLQASAGGINNSQVWFDNVIVTQLDAATPTPTPTAAPTPTATPGEPEPTPGESATPTPTPTPLPALNVPDIKQFWPPWGFNIYDNANLWSTNPFISNWGCALTSATMVLKYYGHDIWPDGLNNWLKTQIDGYLRNGLLNWLAVSRYTLLHDSETSPALEYRRIAPAVENLEDSIENGRPGILGEPGHFVVGKSILPDSFGINDPAYTERTTLASYSNTFNSLGVYTPTHTDLSYIYLAVDADVNIKVFDSSNNEIEGFTQLEDPITDPLNLGLESGEPLKTFMFPTPSNGIYRIILTGTGTYKLDSYIYDEEGNATVNSYTGILANGGSDEFGLTIDESSEIGQEVSIDSIIRDLDEAYLLGMIRRRSIYINLRFQLMGAKRYLSRGRIQQAKTMLSLTRMVIGLYAPAFIDPEASNILRGNLSTLISSL